MDIVIYTTPEKLRHKQGGDGYDKYYWYLSRAPKNFKEGDKVYFAIEGFVRGSFDCEEFNPHDEETICWDKDSWDELKEPIPTRHYQGFKYRWWDK